MKCKLVDVFAKQKLMGNGLTVFYDYELLSQSQMQALTREMKQFESIFLSCDSDGFRARIFTEQEELDFAGHPLLGLCLHLHEAYATEDCQQWQVKLNKKTVTLRSDATSDVFLASMDQGKPEFLKQLFNSQSRVFYQALGLDEPGFGYPAEVVTTGLSYLVLPVDGGLDNVEFKVNDLTPLLAEHNAKFLYLVDIGFRSQIFEGRTWDNDGRVEDIATGSAAGPVGAYLYKHQLSESTQMVIHQGRFVNRPSEITVELECQGQHIENVIVSGSVVNVADINFR